MHRWPALAAASLVAASLLPVAPASAASSGSDGSSKSERIAQVQEQLGEASRAEVGASARLQTIADRRATLDAKVAALDREIGTVRARVAARRREESMLAAAARTLDRRVERNAVRLRAAKQRFDDTAAALYSGNAEAGVAYTSLVFDASSVNEIGSGRVYLEHVADARQHALAAVEALRARNTRLRRSAAAQHTRVERERQAALSEAQTLRGLRAQQAVQRDAAAHAEASAQVVVAKIRDRKAQYAAELTALQATSTQIRALLYDLQRSEPRRAHFHAARPVPGYITSGFGWRYHPVLGYSRMHTGVDFHAGYGEPIHAAAAGEVVWAGVRGGYGNCVVIDHGGQFATLYGHASALYVTVGDRVNTGATIAAVGQSGLATGPHLHFEVRILGNPVDPAAYL